MSTIAARRSSLAVALVVALWTAPALARRHHAPAPDAHDELALAQAEEALAHGDAKTALDALGRVADPPAARHAFRRARLQGLALLAVGRDAEAAAPLRAAQAAAQNSGAALSTSMEIALGTAERAAGRCEAALAALSRAGDAVHVDDKAVLVQADCDKRAGNLARAVDDLNAGIAAHATTRLRAERLRLLCGAGLDDEDDARDVAAALDADELAALASSLRATATAAAELLVDAGLARFPDDARFCALAMRMEARPRLAALTAQRCALLAPARSADAAELLRSAGDRRAALEDNAVVADTGARLRQRLAILVDGREWDRALALEPRLARAGLVSDDAVRYALAYAHFQTGDDERASALLDGVGGDTWFERATDLRAAIAVCREGTGPCAR